MRQFKPEHYHDAVLMDVRMPALDGFKVTGAIRTLNCPGAKTGSIIAMTAGVVDEDVQCSLPVGMNAHIGKPVGSEYPCSTPESLIRDDEL